MLITVLGLKVNSQLQLIPIILAGPGAAAFISSANRILK
jgi:hypothetical protein